METPVRELVVEGGRVVGVRAEKDGRDFWVGARSGVLLAVGGYDHNPKMATMYEEWHEWNSSTQPYFHGDHLVMGGEIGAEIASVFSAVATSAASCPGEATASSIGRPSF